MSQLQIDLYKQLLKSYFERKDIEEMKVDNVLSLLGHLRKIISHSDMLWHNPPSSADMAAVWKSVKQAFPADYEAISDRCQFSSKLSILSRLLSEAISVGDNTVVVSIYTKKLDIVERYCRTSGISFLRLDGNTPIPRRLKIVEQFNSSCQLFPVLLLSLKAGGCGLNLIGGNRLVMLEPDWNPSNDKQAMGRVWRDGQMKPVFIYRLFCSGTVEEKIWQRQTHKENLSTVVVDKKKLAASFKLEDLKELFTLYDNCQSFTVEESHPLTLPEFTNSFIDSITEFVDVVRSCTNDQLEVSVAEEKLEFREAVIETFKRPRAETEYVSKKPKLLN